MTFTHKNCLCVIYTHMYTRMSFKTDTCIYTQFAECHHGVFTCSTGVSSLYLCIFQPQRGCL